VATRWSTAEDQLLRRLYADQLPVQRIAGRLGRSPDAVVARRQKLSVASRRRSRPWSRREEALLRAGTEAGLSASLLAQRLGRSTEQVRTRRRTLVPARPPARPYLAHDDDAIRICLAERGGFTALGRRLGRSSDAVRLHAQQLGIHLPTAAPPLDGLGRRIDSRRLHERPGLRADRPPATASQHSERGRPRPQARTGHLRAPLERPGRPASGPADRPRGHARESGPAARPHPRGNTQARHAARDQAATARTRAALRSPLDKRGRWTAAPAP